MKLYERWGFRECGKDATLEAGFDKVAVYFGNGEYTHGALQLANGRWTSKLGEYEDITHDSLESLSGSAPDEYGDVFCIMKRDRHDAHTWPTIYPRRKMKKQ